MLKLKLNFGNNRNYDVIAIPSIPFIIGDFKGNDILDRKGDHSFNIKELRRKRGIESLDGNNTCIDRELVCTFHDTANIV